MKLNLALPFVAYDTDRADRVTKSADGSTSTTAESAFKHDRGISNFLIINAVASKFPADKPDTGMKSKADQRAWKAVQKPLILAMNAKSKEHDEIEVERSALEWLLEVLEAWTQAPSYAVVWNRDLCDHIGEVLREADQARDGENASHAASHAKKNGAGKREATKV